MRVGRITKGSMFRKNRFAGTGFFWIHKGSGDCIYAISSEASSHQVLNDFLNIYDIENRKHGAVSNSMIRFFCSPQDSYYLKRELSARGFLFKFRLNSYEQPVDLIVNTESGSFKVAGGIVSSTKDSKVVAAIFENDLGKEKIVKSFNGNNDFSFNYFGNDPKNLVEDVINCRPDVILLSLDVDGFTPDQFMKDLYKKSYIPTVIASFKTDRNSERFVKCFKEGASDFISMATGSDIEILLQQKLFNCVEHSREETKPVPRSVIKGARFATTDGVLVIGASTGGTEAVRGILETLPLEGPPIVVAQHIPKYFASAFNESLQRSTKKKVYEAENGMKVEPNSVYLPPGGKHIRIEGAPGAAKLVLIDPQAELNYVPSVDILFESAASIYKKGTYGVILTGMGRDGALGCAEIKRVGGNVIAQNKETCVVYGMPRVVIEQDLADIICPLSAVPSYLLKLVA